MVWWICIGFALYIYDWNDEIWSEIIYFVTIVWIFAWLGELGFMFGLGMRAMIILHDMGFDFFYDGDINLE